ncbi:MAG TPA: methyltransferase [Candidatus Nitrosopolaris sp.]|nr:methyltransferase [Candidatus Nitrosopolaris sp.]
MSPLESPLKSVTPSPIMQMATGFWVSKTLMAAVELSVFTKISAYQNHNDSKSITLKEFQNIVGIEESRPAEAFTTALVSLGLLKLNKNNDGEKTFANSELSSMFLDKSKSTYIGDVIAMFDERLYKRWDKLAQALKTNKPVGEKQGEDIESIFDKAKSNQEAEQLQKFTHAMHGVSIGQAMALTQNVDFSKHTKMMDIGGGSGIYAIQVVANSPNMSAVVLDSKPVCQVADRYIRQYNLQDKVQTMTFDLFKDQFPSDCDVAFLSHVLHIFDRDKNITLLKKIYDSLPNENGIIIISEWLLNDEKSGPIPSALMGLTMIIENSGGRGYSYNEISQMLTEVDFKNIERRALIEPAEIVIGYKK